MARGRKKTKPRRSSGGTHHRRSSSTSVRAIAPVVIQQRAPVVHHKRRKGGGGGGIGGFGGGLASKENIALGMGALALGFIDKNQDKWHIPTVPMIGRKGSIAVLAHFGGKYLHWPILGKISKAAIVLALYELGHEGKISGVDVL